MRSFTFIMLVLVLVLALAACSPAPTVIPQPAGPSATPVVVATQPPAAAPLTLDQLKNMTYALQQSDPPRTVTLVNGNFTSPDPAALDYVNINLLDKVAFGDLDGDGDEDAAVLVAESYGGSGDFISLVAITNDNGQPVQGASLYIDDRAQANDLAAGNGVITLDAIVHGPNDPMCCPTQRKVMSFTLTQQGLTLQTVTTFTPDGKERSIMIQLPTAGADLSGSVQLSGSFTISPFENTLAFKIYDASGTELVSGPITVTAPELGGPGTFDTTVDLGVIQAGTQARITVQDISAADGSILAMASVTVTVK
jgi:immunoglobulin-like protein involved in spore germination